MRHRIPLAKLDDNFRVAPASSSIIANHFEVGLLVINADEGRYMTGFERVRDGFFDEPRRFDLQAAEFEVQSRWVLDRIDIHSDTCAVDIGCGPLGILDLLSERVGKTGSAVGLERNCQ